MDRREYISTTTATLAIAAGLGGCTERALESAEEEPPIFDGFHAEEEVRLPVTQRLGIGADGVRTTDDADVPTPAELSTVLEEQGLQVESLHEETTDHELLVSLEYVPDRAHSRGLMHHLGIVAGATAALVAGGHEMETLEASLHEPDGTTYGTYEVRRHWAVAYEAGTLSAREYVGEVLQHAESV